MKKLFSITFFLLVSVLLFAQNKLLITVTDSSGQEKLQGVSVTIAKTKKGGTTDSSGRLVLNNIPDGNHAISFSIIGYKPITVNYIFPLDNPEVTIVMEKAEEEKAISMSLRMKEIMAESKQKEEAEKQRKESEADTLKRLDMFKQVLEIDGDDLLANFGTGSCLVELGRFEESLVFLNKAISVKPDYTNAYLYLGKAHLGLNDSNQASSSLVKGIEVAAKRGDGEPLKAMQILLNGLETKMSS